MPFTKGENVVARPVSYATQAAAAWAAPQATCLSSCTHAPGAIYASPTISTGALGPVCEARPNNYGGLNPEINPTPFYDPRSVLMRAPVVPMEGGGELITPPMMAHGPAAFFSDVGPPLPRTQYAPQGVIPMPPGTLLDVETCGCAAPLCAAFPYSLAGLMLTSPNALTVRDMMEQAGIVRVTRRLRALGVDTCSCVLLGSVYPGFAQYARIYEDTPVRAVLDPAATVFSLDRQFVDQVLGSIRSQVLAAARANYLRAEGPRAYLQDRPVAEEEAPPPELPACLPGSGLRTTPADTPFTARALANPLASAANRAALTAATGVPIGSGCGPLPLPEIFESWQCATAPIEAMAVERPPLFRLF